VLVFNAGWDIRRLWLTQFSEEKHKCTIAGYGRSNEDVAEFLRRLNLSESFEKVTLQSTQFASNEAGRDGTAGVKFALNCEVKY
jgi:Tfp pilus assembly protein PilN